MGRQKEWSYCVPEALCFGAKWLIFLPLQITDSCNIIHQNLVITLQHEHINIFYSSSPEVSPIAFKETKYIFLQ